MKPELGEIRQEFIRRGASDDLITLEIPDYELRVKYLSDVFDKYAQEEGFVAKLEQIFTGIRGKTGDKGEKGEDGYTPRVGIDYFTKQEIEKARNEIKEGITPVVIKEITKPKIIKETIVQKVEIPVDTITTLINKSIDSLRTDNLMLLVKTQAPSQQVAQIGGGLVRQLV